MRAYDLMFRYHKRIKCVIYKYDPNTPYLPDAQSAELLHNSCCMASLHGDTAPWLQVSSPFVSVVVLCEVFLCAFVFFFCLPFGLR
jgi:hypothetical protein